MKSSVMEEVKRLFKPEFINRIDEIMVFHPLTDQDMKQIVTLLSKNLCERCKTQMDIDMTFTSTLKEYLVKKHSDLKMGARPLKRAIQNVVENELATAILEGKVKRGDSVTAGVRNDKVTFTVKEQKENTDPERLSFCTTIFIHPQFLPSHEGRNEGRNGTKKEKGNTPSSTRTERILSAISENPHITMRALAEELDIPRSSVERILKNLREAGVVRHEGATKKGRWVML